MPSRIEFNGPMRYEIRSALSTCRSIVGASVKHALKRRGLPGWNFAVEISTRVMRDHLRTAFTMSVEDGRRYLDSIVLHDARTLSKVRMTATAENEPPGSWFVPKNGTPQVTLLYLHGGGFSFYPRNYANLIAAVALTANAVTFAPDYRLSPEHRFPAALEDALNAYRWLLRSTNARELVVAGDSAGGNLTLALLQAARDSGLPMPALAVALSPATDFVVPDDLLATASFLKNTPFDWIQPTMLIKWADWYCDVSERRDPLVSPIYADLRGLPPIYIQAGTAEILFDSIQAFADQAKRQGASVTLETWDCMNHDFQMYGNTAPQSVHALRRIGEVISGTVRNAGTKQDTSSLRSR